MHRLRAFLSIVVLLTTTSLFAQEQEEEPLPPKRATSKLGGAGGFTPSWLFFDVDPINQVLAGANCATFQKGGMPLYGGQGYAYIMFLPNVRIGGMGAGGTMESKSVQGNTTRDVQLSISFGGGTVDYVVPLSTRFDLTLGILLGSGSVSLSINRDDGQAKKWDDLWSDYGNNTIIPVYPQDYSRKLSSSFFVYQPSVNVEYALLRWLGFRLGVSYMGMAGGSWKLDDKYDVFGVPDNISGKGLMINTGVFLGTFMF